MPQIPNWLVAGDWFDNCSCAVACPCTFAQPPDNGFCDSVLFWHIQRGQYGECQSQRSQLRPSGQMGRRSVGGEGICDGYRRSSSRAQHTARDANANTISRASTQGGRLTVRLPSSYLRRGACVPRREGVG
jgi:uncharacterized protein DUF1326